MKTKLTMTILLALVATLTVAAIETMSETETSQQKAYADEPAGAIALFCPRGHHWNSDLHHCVAD